MYFIFQYVTENFGTGWLIFVIIGPFTLLYIAFILYLVCLSKIQVTFSCVILGYLLFGCLRTYERHCGIFLFFSQKTLTKSLGSEPSGI